MILNARKCLKLNKKYYVFKVGLNIDTSQLYLILAHTKKKKKY